MEGNISHRLAIIQASKQHFKNTRYNTETMTLISFQYESFIKSSWIAWAESFQNIVAKTKMPKLSCEPKVYRPRTRRSIRRENPYNNEKNITKKEDIRENVNPQKKIHPTCQICKSKINVEEDSLFHGLSRVIRRRYFPRKIALCKSPTQVRDRRLGFNKLNKS